MDRLEEIQDKVRDRQRSFGRGDVQYLLSLIEPLELKRQTLEGIFNMSARINELESENERLRAQLSRRLEIPSTHTD